MLCSHAGQGRDTPAAGWPTTVPTAPYGPRAWLDWAHPREIGAYMTQGLGGQGSGEALGTWGQPMC